MVLLCNEVNDHFTKISHMNNSQDYTVERTKSQGAKRQALHSSGGNSFTVGARVVRSGWVGLYGRPPSPKGRRSTLHRLEPGNFRVYAMLSIRGGYAASSLNYNLILSRV